MLIKEIVNNSIVIYSIKSLNKIKSKYSGLLYIFIYSPLLLYTGFYYKDIVSYNYWRFLLSLTYPEHKKNNEIFNDECKIYHINEENCNIALINNYKKTIIMVFVMYSKFYSLSSLLTLLINRNKWNIKNDILNIMYSTLFLSCQTIFQRILLCNTNKLLINNKNKDILNKIKFYMISLVCSIPIFFERNNRKTQINNMIISNLTIGYLNKINNNYIYKFMILLFVLLKERKINRLNALFSILSSKI